MNKELSYKLLWATIEEYTGLWELCWETNSTLNSISTLNQELVKKILLYFLQLGLVDLYYDVWGADRLQKINSLEAVEIIKGHKFWEPPEINELCVKVSCTKKGRKYYDDKLIKDDPMFNL